MLATHLHRCLTATVDDCLAAAFSFPVAGSSTVNDGAREQLAADILHKRVCWRCLVQQRQPLSFYRHIGRPSRPVAQPASFSPACANTSRRSGAAFTPKETGYKSFHNKYPPFNLSITAKVSPVADFRLDQPLVNSPTGLVACTAPNGWVAPGPPLAEVQCQRGP